MTSSTPQPAEHPTEEFWDILVVDDDESVRQLTGLVLRNLRVLGRTLRIHEAASATEAGAFLSSPHPPIAVMLVDVIMETDRAGLDFIRWVRTQPHLDPTRIVIRTGEPGVGAPRELLRDFQVSDYWPKTSVLASRMQMQIVGLIRAYDQLRTLDAERQSEAKSVRSANLALENLKQQHEAVRSVANAIDAGLLLIQDDAVALTNATALDLLGLGEAPRLQDLPLPIQTGSADSTAEFTHIKPGGDTIWLRVQMRSYVQDQRPGLLVTITDQTRQRKSESKRIQAETELLRTQHTEHVSLLAGGVAHDLNNLLAVITSNTEFLKEELGTPDQQEALSDIAGATREAASLVRQLLAYSGSGSVFRRELDLVASVANSARLWRAQARDAGVELGIVMPDAPISAVSDSALIGQIVGNLLSNAIRHAPADSAVTVELSAGEVSAYGLKGWGAASDLEPGYYALLSVRDAGNGIPTAEAERIFEPFYTTAPGGRGLGLAAVKGIVKRLGGAIRVRPNDLIGSNFEVLFPAQAPAASLASAGQDSLQGIDSIVRASDTQAGSSDRHILILDDMPLVRKQLGRIAKRAGLHAVLCGTIPEALAAASQTRFDAAIIDYQLQGATGDDALLQLRGLQPSLRAILCTGYAGSQDFADLPVVFDAVVHKPFRPADLTKTLFAVLDREEQPAAG